MNNLFEDKSTNWIKIGDKSIHRLGLGTNKITDTPEIIQFLHQATEAGINFIDTAYVYQNGASETTIGKALNPFAENLVVATKGGMDASHGGNNQPDFLRSNLEESLERLQTKCITLYQIHRLDSNIPIEQTMNLLKTFQAEGKIEHIGLSEVSLNQLKEASKYAEIVSVQNQYSLTLRAHQDVLDYCSDNNIIFLPWFPLRDVNNDASLRRKLGPIAEKYQLNPQQLVLTWLLKKSPMMLPIPGTLSINHLQENIAATSAELNEEDFKLIDQIN